MLHTFCWLNQNDKKFWILFQSNYLDVQCLTQHALLDKRKPNHEYSVSLHRLIPHESHSIYRNTYMHFYNMTWNCNFAIHHLSRQYRCYIFFSYQAIDRRSPVYIKSDYTIWMREIYSGNTGLEWQITSKTFQTSINYLSKPVTHGTLVKIKAESCVSI